MKRTITNSPPRRGEQIGTEERYKQPERADRTGRCGTGSGSCQQLQPERSVFYRSAPPHQLPTQTSVNQPHAECTIFAFHRPKQ